jgi:hypothetical protein
MPTNRELIAQAQALSTELGVDAPTDRLNNAQLTALVAQLEKQKAERGAGGSEAAAAAAAMGAGAAQQRKHPYEVAAGRSITSPRGVLGPGVEVRLTDYAPDDLENLVALGYIVRNT